MPDGTWGGADAAWDAYRYRKLITVQAGQVAGGPHTNFPMLFNETDADIAARSRSDGFDIRFALTDAAALDYDRDEWLAPPVSTRQICHVRVPSLTAGQQAYVYYGNPTAADGASGAGTYGGKGYSAVWHLKEGAAPADSTGNGHTGTIIGTTVGAGKIGLCADFLRADSDYITALDSSDWDFDGGDFSVSMLARFHSQPGNEEIYYLMGRRPFAVGQKAWRFTYYNNAGVKKLWFNWSPDGTAEGNLLFAWSATLNTWYHMAVVRTGNTVRVDVNGVDVGNTPLVGNIFNSNEILALGGDGTTYFIDGRIDEARVLKGTALSDDWLLTESRNQNDPSSFYTLGAEEDRGVAPPPAPSPSGAPTSGDVSVAGARQVRRYRRSRIQRPTKG